jgi:hypothetical protein
MPEDIYRIGMILVPDDLVLFRADGGFDQGGVWTVPGLREQKSVGPPARFPSMVWTKAERMLDEFVKLTVTKTMAPLNTAGGPASGSSWPRNSESLVGPAIFVTSMGRAVLLGAQFAVRLTVSMKNDVSLPSSSEARN